MTPFTYARAPNVASAVREGAMAGANIWAAAPTSST